MLCLSALFLNFDQEFGMLKLFGKTNIFLLVLISSGWNMLIALPGATQTDSLQLVPDTTPLPLNGELVPLDSAEPTIAPQSTQDDDSAIAPAFTFTNTLEYGDCLEVILRFHENVGGLREREQQNRCYTEIQQRFGTEGISRDEALRLISAANFYATTLLGTDLYPPRGQRIRVARLFGFIYAIDTNDAQIRAFAAQAQP
jgi:hypothetical protein